MDAPLILIVDDEEHLARLASRLLEKAGYRTVATQSATEALALAQMNREIRLVLTDCIMPEMLGQDLARELASLEGGPDVIFMSGNDIESLGTEVPLKEGENFIQKPFAPERLKQIVARALGGAH